MHVRTAGAYRSTARSTANMTGTVTVTGRHVATATAACFASASGLAAAAGVPPPPPPPSAGPAASALRVTTLSAASRCAARSTSAARARGCSPAPSPAAARSAGDAARCSVQVGRQLRASVGPGRVSFSRPAQRGGAACAAPQRPARDHASASRSTRSTGTTYTASAHGHPARAVASRTCLRSRARVSRCTTTSAATGAPLLVVHGMASDAAAWAPALDELAAAGVRAIAYDRRGYGASGAPEPYAATTIQEQAEDAAALLSALDAAPAVLVGDGFGALVVLELLVRRPQLASAAVLADLPLFAFVPAATAALADERTLLEQALRDGGQGDAIHAWIADRADVVRAGAREPLAARASSPTTPASSAGRRRARELRSIGAGGGRHGPGVAGARRRGRGRRGGARPGRAPRLRRGHRRRRARPAGLTATRSVASEAVHSEREGVAFVLGGGGGPLGAHEVGMLRALLERGIVPDLVLGTSIGAINGAAVAADPTAKGRSGSPTCGRDMGVRRLRRVRAAARGERSRARAPTCTATTALRGRLAAAFGARRIEELAVPFQCVAASIERASRALVRRRAARRRRPRLGRRARHPAARRDRRRALHRRRHRQQHPGEPRCRARARSGSSSCTSAASTARSSRRAGRGRSRSSPSRSRAATASSATSPALPEGVDVHVLPTGAGATRRATRTSRSFATATPRMPARASRGRTRPSARYLDRRSAALMPVPPTLVRRARHRAARRARGPRADRRVARCSRWSPPSPRR